MPDERSEASAAPGHGANGAGRVTELATLRRLLVGPEQERLADLARRLDELEITPAALADHLPDAIALRGGRDRQLGRALAPSVETALRESIQRNPREIATAIFPVLGPAIRKAIAETMAGLVRSINRAVEHSLTIRGLRWRVEAWRAGVPYAEILIRRALVYRVEQVFLIHADSGLLLAHVSAPELDVADADLISGMLTAIQDFVRDAFRPAEGGTLRTFCVGEHTVHVEAGPQALIAAVIRGQAPDTVMRRLQDVLETVHLHFATPLAEFSGDAAPFEGARPMLSECLETVLATERPTSSRRAVLRWAFPLLLFVVVVAAAWIRAEVRFRRAIAALRAAPGIVVLDASRSGRGWRLWGLRDPLAGDPATVLAAAGFAPSPLRATWQPYLALDSTTVIARARRVLDLPEALVPSLRVDTLVLRGTAQLDWLARVRRSALPPGVSRVDLSAVEPAWPAGLDSLRRAIEGDRVLFAAGSADLSPASDATTRFVTSRFRPIADSAIRSGAVARLVLLGRTDPSGTSETNQALARWRVDAVAARLMSLGVDSAILVREAIATGQPLPAEDAASHARINRSVSFLVRLATGPNAPRER